MAERTRVRAIAAALLVVACGGDHAARPQGEVRQRLVDGGAPATRDAGAPDAPGRSSDAAPEASVLLPPLTPNATTDFLTPSPPKLVLTRMAQFFPKQLPDLSVDPPEPHDYLSPSDIEFFPDGSGDSLVALSTGLVVWLDRSFAVRGTFQVDSTNSLAKYRARGKQFKDNEGLLGIAFDPHFAENGWFYLHLNSEHLGGVDIWKLRWKPDQVSHLWEGRQLIFHADKPAVAADPAYLGNHDSGNPSFGPDGFLYVALGDGGIGGGLPWDTNAAQDLAEPWGKLLRVDPSGKAPPEIAAYGLRNPFTHSFRGNELFIGDVSADWPQCSDEIDRLVVTPGQSAPPVNFGWPRTCGPCTAETVLWQSGCDGMVDPVHSYRKDSTSFVADDPEATFPVGQPGAENPSAIILGPAYAGGAYGGYLDNVVLYSDVLQGWLRGVLFDAQGHELADRHLLHHDVWITAYAVGPDTRIYLLGGFVTDFSVYRIDLAPP